MNDNDAIADGGSTWVLGFLAGVVTGGAVAAATIRYWPRRKSEDTFEGIARSCELAVQSLENRIKGTSGDSALAS